MAISLNIPQIVPTLYTDGTHAVLAYALQGGEVYGYTRVDETSGLPQDQEMFTSPAAVFLSLYQPYAAYVAAAQLTSTTSTAPTSSDTISTTP